MARATLLAIAALAALTRSSTAGAQLTIQQPGQRPLYRLELEPHLDLGFDDPPGPGTGWGYGVGGRATFEILRDGFIPNIDDSVGIGVGLDFAHYDGNGDDTRGTCQRFAPGPAGTPVCVQVSQTAGGPSNYWFWPLVMQWNFWLTPRWSVFGEPGLAMYLFDDRRVGVVPVLYLGGRFQLTRAITLTMRLGYPTISFGASFLL
jgi:hypothetical protein